MSFIEFNNLWKSYGDHIIFEKINKNVNEGDFITVVGASGCGKTSFLKLLLGTESPSRGTITLEGKPIVAEPSPDRGIVFQRYSVFPHLTVLENVILSRELEQSHFIGKLFGKKRTEAIKEALTMLDLVGLSAAQNKYPHQLSGGMQQRLAIAQSLLKRPRILLLDEPFGALDPGIRSDMHQLVLDLWREYKLTIFMITHDIKEGFYLGTRLWVFDKVRNDPHSPNAYGAQITYDLPVGEDSAEILSEIESTTYLKPSTEINT